VAKKSLPQNLNGNILYVGGNGPGNYTTIQNAVDAASDSDTIFVYAGTYYGIITISKSVTLTGEDKNNTVIDGGSSGNVVNVTADNVNITGFTVQNGGSSPRDAGIELYSVQNCNITGNTINNNTWRGIYLSYSSNNIITGNTISNSWYGS
jgi:parallel beta-helix repeat protein